MQIKYVRELLEKLGYAFVVKDGEWVRCAISGHGEQWMGKGLDEDGAIQDAYNQMFPSHAARNLLEAELRTEEHREATAEFMQKVEEDVAKQEAPTEPEPVPEPSKVEVEPPEPEPKKVAPPIVRKPKAKIILVSDQTPAPEPQTYVSPEPEEPEEPEITREEALAMVEGILDEMEDNYGDVAQMSTLYQRLHMSDWIFRSRAIEEKFKKDELISDAVHRVARRLTDWCKILWPGSIKALQIYTLPSQSLDGLISYKTRPQSWGEAAVMVEEALEDFLSGGGGRDEFGWQDKSLLRPESPNPDAVLKEAITRIEKVLGPLGGPLDDKRKTVNNADIEANADELVLAGHLVRWVRHSADPAKVGMAMGALRWASRQPRSGSMNPLKKLMEDQFRPSQSWASLLGRDPEVNRKNVIRKKVMSALPTPEWLEEDLMDWLTNAFQVFNNPQIAKLGDAVSAEILELTNADFADADRSARTRLRKLQSILRNRNVDMDKVDLPTAEELEGSEEDLTEVMPKVVDPTAMILKRVQEITEGKSILFVTNRPEARLHRDLERDLKAKVHYKVGDTARTMKPIIKGVSASRYDMVLMATGFNNHSADAALSRATKGEGLPYIRVQKGRLASTIRAIARAFNVLDVSKDDNSEGVAHTG